MTTLEAIYENGIFKPVSDVPQSLKEHERVRITIETDTDEDLQAEFAQWEAESDQDFLEASLGEKRSVLKRKNGHNVRSATRIVDETFGATHSIRRKDLILLAEDEEFSGY